MATLLSGFTTTVPMCMILRFLAGFGLSGELGVGVAVVTEAMSAQRRGLGTMVIATCGVLGSATAGIIGTQIYWRYAFILGGLIGFALLLLRITVVESEVYNRARQSNVSRGSLLMLVTDGARLKKYLLCVGVGLPIYVVMGLLMTGAPEIGKALGLAAAPLAGTAILVCHLSMGVGDVGCSVLSQFLQSRRRALMVFNGIALVGVLFYLYVPSVSLNSFYGRCAVVGFGCGFWALVTTNAAEQFGTNLRATVATSVPNLIRATLIPIAFCYEQLRPGLGLVNAAGLLGVGCAVVAIFSAFCLEEKFGTNLDYVE